MKKVISKTILSFLGLVMMINISGCSTASKEVAIETKESIQEKSQENIQEDKNEELVKEVQDITQFIFYSACKGMYEDAPFQEIISELKTGEIDREIAIHRIQNILATYKCAHLGFYTLPNDPIYLDRIPVSIEKFEEGYFITAADEKYKEYVGMQVIDIAGLSVQEVNSKLDTLVGCETESGRSTIIMTFGLADTELKYLGLYNADNELEMTLQDNSGDKIKAVFKAVKYDEIREVKVSETIPEYFDYKEYGIPFMHKGDSEAGVMHFMYYSCSDNGDETVADEMAKILDEMEKNNSYHTLVFDVRCNHGGNRNLLYYALAVNKERIQKYNVVVLNGTETYSAAMQLSEDCLQLFDNTVIYGEETGQKIDNLTEVKVRTYENLNCVLMVPTVHDTVQKLRHRAEDTERGVIPDVYVMQKYSDYIKGIDTAYELIKENVNQ